VNLLGDNIYTGRRNTKSLIDGNKDADLGVNAEKTVYVAVSLPEYRQNHAMKIGSRSFKNVAQSKYLGTTVTNQISFRRKLRGD
jgi:phosphodiesterase/alkaline phosphatase D-like protein